jgi:hypothetical protein
MALGNGKKISPKQIFDNIIKPLADKVIKIVAHFQSCFSGCMVDEINQLVVDTKIETPVCLWSKTSSDTFSYSSDNLFGNTNEQTYPEFLKELGNPLYAQLCAMALDPFNQAKQANGNQPNPTTPNTTPHTETIDQVFKDIAALTNDPAIEKLGERCPKVQIPTTEGQLDNETTKKVLRCEKIKMILQKSMPDFFNNMWEIFVNKFQKPDSWPGLEGLKNLRDSLKSQKNTKFTQNCSINLKEYSQQSLPTGNKKIIERTQ